jgi:hypothetical protein
MQQIRKNPLLLYIIVGIFLDTFRSYKKELIMKRRRLNIPDLHASIETNEGTLLNNSGIRSVLLISRVTLHFMMK